MTQVKETRTFDALLYDLQSFKQQAGLSDTITAFLDGNYKSVLRNGTSQTLYKKLNRDILSSRENQISGFLEDEFVGESNTVLVFLAGLAAFNAFLQANVTGPPLELGDVFPRNNRFREECLKNLEVDGVSVYQYIPHIELFCLAHSIFTVYFPRLSDEISQDCKWMRIRINTIHQRLLSGLSGGRLSDSSLLQDAIEHDLGELEKEVLGEGSGYGTEAKVQFLLEKAQIYIMQGLDLKAQDNVGMAKRVSGFESVLSGALGKRTKFQQNDISQLVVFAKSKEVETEDASAEVLTKTLNGSTLESGRTSGEERNVPNALNLNDDTLLETIEFTKVVPEEVGTSDLPAALAGMQPDDQPQLNPLDQITLLTEATIKDTFSPLDMIGREEILPYAVRVLADKPTNWQIYTQALLVRSRIESHRSRTMERSVLQLQVIVDQIIADTQEEAPLSPDGIPAIRVTQFLPRAKASEVAPVQERLKYIYQLNTPTRWEVETELAYAWSSAGSLFSALEIFKRLHLWAEVALCFHSVGKEEKARQVVRRQLYYSSKGPEMDKYNVDSDEVVTEKWDGEIRSPPPPHSPRLWCILGDLEQDPTCWERAWEISKNRYARAQRTLGEYYTRKGDLESARAAYMKATVVNRQNNETWSLLGDLDLRAGNWDGAIVAFQQSIMIDDTDAKTYNNLGSALLSKYTELIKLQKVDAKHDEDDEFVLPIDTSESPKDVLKQALIAFKRGASLAHDNWKIWDNVVTIAGRMSPPAFSEILMGMRAVIRIRSPKVGEDAVDVDILRALVLEVTSRERLDGETIEGIYHPPRGSLARATIQMVEEDVVPLITKRAELWALMEKLALYRRDYAEALKCAERAWRMASAGEAWLVEEEKWKGVVAATDNLASAYENYGPMETADGKEVEKGWKGKARNAVRGVMGKARDAWEGTAEWDVLSEKLEEVKGL